MTVDADTRTLTRVRPWRGRCATIDVNVAEATVTIPDGVAFDPGGIGKGRAADLVARRALECGATSVLVDIGGDLRLAGTPPAGGWRVEVEDPANPVASLVTLRIIVSPAGAFFASLPDGSGLSPPPEGAPIATGDAAPRLVAGAMAAICAA